MIAKKEAAEMLSKGFIPAAGASDVSGVSLSTVHRKCRDGKIENHKCASHLYVEIKALFQYYGTTEERVEAMRLKLETFLAEHAAQAA